VASARDANGKFLYMITQIENIDGRKRAESQREQLQCELEYRARHDSLTGLINRQSFEQTLEAMLNSPTDDRQHSICFIDLDRFKILNDSAGHAAGDLLLRQIAQRLQQRVRSHDILARLGGDEFGSGLSSFTCLKNFAVDIVKIDGGFVRELAESRIDRAIVESISQIAHEIGAMTVAESVESADIDLLLRQVGVDFGQGYHYARPEPLSGLLQRLAQEVLCPV
jgi:diguanylate cyclase (GGDEF)-like protein